MAYSRLQAEWFDLISRCNNTSESDPEPTDDALAFGECFFGFDGLEGIKFVYRVLGPYENIGYEIVCKDKYSSRTVEQHIASGSRYGSRFISTTSDLEVAAYWSFFEMDTPERKCRQTPLPIVAIELSQLIGTKNEKECINLCKKEVREHFLKGATHRSWAIASKEVLFQFRILKYLPIYLLPRRFTPQFSGLTVPFPEMIGTLTGQMPFNVNPYTGLSTQQFYTETVPFPVLICTQIRQMALLVNQQTGIFTAKFFAQIVPFPVLIGTQTGKMPFHVNPQTGLFTAQFFTQTVPFPVLLDTYTGQMRFLYNQQIGGQFLTIYDFKYVSKPAQPPPKKPKTKK